MIGRDVDLAELDAELAHSRLVSVQGPPGVGKTRLAHELALQLIRRGQVVVRCDVTECVTVQDVVVRVAGALGDATSELAEQLAARPLVLLIDNAEQLAPELAACVESWLVEAPELRVLVTTQVRLRAAGEVVFDLHPLDDAAACELFIERARTIRRIGAFDRAVVLELVRRLDGIPLAIELAAARTRLDEPEQLLAEGSLLRSGAADANPLTTALELSYGLLSPVESAEAALVVGPGVRWFRAPGSKKVDLSKRRQLRRILGALTTERRERPGRSLSVSAVLGAGWPDEAVPSEAGASRVYVAVSTLRRMGLGSLLMRSDEGYLIDPEVPLVVQSEAG